MKDNKGLILIIAVIVMIIISISLIIISIFGKSDETIDTVKPEDIVIIDKPIENNNNINIQEEIVETIGQNSGAIVNNGPSNKLSNSEIEAIKKMLAEQNKPITGGNISTENNQNNDNNVNVEDKTENNNSGPNKEEQKKYNIYISEIIEEKQKDKNKTNSVKLLGNPLKDNVYKDDSVNNIIARNIWDMQLYNNRIYIGSGDYDKNKGPVHLYYYDIGSETFIDDGDIPDEQIGRIIEMDGVLYVPGIDPRDGWDLGNYFTFDGTEWTKHRKLPGGLHNFDILKKGNMIFAGVGLDKGAIAVAVSKDNGETYELVPLLKEGKEIELEDKPRVYDVFEFKNEVYAIDGNQYELYKYDSNTNKFLYCDDKQVYIRRLGYGTLGLPIERKIVYKDNMIFTYGSMTYTNDLKEYKELTFDKSTLVRDVKILNEKLQILCQTQVATNDYIIGIYETSDMQNWDLKFYFKSADEIRSFETSNNVYYFGVGTTNDSSTAEGKVNSGNIIKVEL